MTNREFYEAIANGTINAEVQAHAADAIAKLDATNAKRREKSAEKANANQALVDMLVGFLGDEPKTATDILGMFEGTERPDGKAFNVQFVTSLARAAVEQGKAVSADVKVPKKGTQKGYTLA